jgi:hypothetical protein
MKLLLVACLAGCWSTSTAPPTPPANTRPDPPKPHEKLEVDLEHTPCMGRCAVYRLAIHDDNTVVFTGLRNVSAMGEQRGTMPAAKRDALLAAIEKVKFFDYKNTVMCTDTSRGKISITLGARSHEATNMHCGDDPLDPLEAAILDAAGAEQWIKGTPTM